MDDNRWTVLETVLLTLAVLLIFAALICIIWASLDRLSWVRFIMHSNLPGWLKMLLYGWY